MKENKDKDNFYTAIINNLGRNIEIHIQTINNLNLLIDTLMSDNQQLADDYVLLQAELDKKMNLVNEFINKRGFSKEDLAEFEMELKFK